MRCCSLSLQLGFLTWWWYSLSNWFPLIFMWSITSLCMMWGWFISACWLYFPGSLKSHKLLLSLFPFSFKSSLICFPCDFFLFFSEHRRFLFYNSSCLAQIAATSRKCGKTAKTTKATGLPGPIPTGSFTVELPVRRIVHLHRLKMQIPDVSWTCEWFCWATRHLSTVVAKALSYSSKGW